MSNRKGAEVDEDSPISIEPAAGELSLQCFAPTVWLTYNFARDWYEDALAEAGRPLSDADPDALRTHRKAVRREIMFAACAVEGYLVEWVRDDVLRRDFPALNEFFPAGARLTLQGKWTRVLEKLVRNRLLATLPRYSKRHAQEWANLVEYRNGLVHARTARPYTSGLPANETPVPDFYVLNALPRGWACNVVAEQIEALHRSFGTEPPQWLSRPPLEPPPAS
jgi:hypothetical protein